MKPLLSFYIFALVLLNCFFSTTCLKNATAPGDIIIGGLFPIHEGVSITTAEDGTEIRTCNMYTNSRLVQSLIMVQAVEEVNRRKEMGNLTLGYLILDSCSDVTTALTNTMYFMKRDKLTSPPVLAVLGDYYSEISIAVARQLNLEYIPQISYGATSGFLSDKTRFSNFMRTVPEDDHQAHAIAKILQNHNWTWVGVVTTDSDYGRYIFERLQEHAANNNICFAFISILPDVLDRKVLKKPIDATVNNIIKHENVSVIVSFAKPYHMMNLFRSLVKNPKARKKVWVASDIWSDSAGTILQRMNLTLSDIGTVFGTSLKSGNSTRFEQYLKNLDTNPYHQENNTFLKYFLENEQGSETWGAVQNVSSTQGRVVADSDCGVRSKSKAICKLLHSIYPYAVFSVELAVRAIAKAVANLCVNRDCKTNETLQPVELRKALMEANFQLDGTDYKFDNRGDLNTGYDVVLWQQISETVVDAHYVVAHYNIADQKLTIMQQHYQDVLNVTRGVISSCSERCGPGTWRKNLEGLAPCCYVCEECPINTFSNITDATKCEKCNETTQYSKDKKECVKKDTIFLEWDNPYSIVLLTFTTLGAVLTIVVGIIFLAHWNTPVVRACVGPICIILLFSLLSTFVSVILFAGKPNDKQCQTRQALFGLSFTLCVSCIMVKSFKIILAFEFDPSVKRVLDKLYKPYIIIAAAFTGQVLICALWLIFKAPKHDWSKLNDNKKRLLRCNEMAFEAFGVMLAYIGVLALICFAVAFKGRKLPQSYNDAKFITFSMLIYFICWVIFGPVYVNVEYDKYHPALEMVVILISSYGILFCQFFTKCYIILFKQEANTESAFLKDVRNYSFDIQDGLQSPCSTGGIENTAVVVESPTPELLSLDRLTDQGPSMGSSMGSSSPLFPEFNPQLEMLQSKNNNNKRELRRYLSLPQ